MKRTKLSEEHQRAVLHAAEDSYLEYAVRLDGLAPKKAYVTGWFDGYRWAVEVFVPELEETALHRDKLSKIEQTVTEDSYKRIEAKLSGLTIKQIYMKGCLDGYSVAVDVFAPEIKEENVYERLRKIRQ